MKNSVLSISYKKMHLKNVKSKTKNLRRRKQKWSSNYEKLKSGKVVNSSIEFIRPNSVFKNYILHPVKTNNQIGRFAVLHNIDIKNVKMESDNIITMELVDYYDFSKLDDNKTFFNTVNNIAYKEQALGKMKPYLIYKKLKYKLK